ncbi:hypothetical protein MA16_Dca006224 [Dendrobium catenatum]|uniref:Uncharacterized protein n=1 Tax=Dendrobium catenatum TaxID=906689 RepID=A0A2I0X4T9_9ASPA|nr:hypothetical protein MA16_Dca006224 [Dendrobium catenatum]
MAGDPIPNPWGKVSSPMHGNHPGFFNLKGGESSKSPTRSFKDVLAGNPMAGENIPNLTQSIFNGVPDVLLSDEGLHFFNPKVLHSLGAIFGCPLQTDQATATRTRPSVARVLVEVDISKKHAKEIWVGSKSYGYL